MKNEEEDTATESDDSQYSYTNTKMPPLKYARICGSLARSSVESKNATANDGGSNQTAPFVQVISCSTFGQADTPVTTPNNLLLVTGNTHGTLQLTNTHGESVLYGSTLDDGGMWHIAPKKSSKVVAVALDSGCGSLAAVNSEGDVAIFGLLIWGCREEELVKAKAPLDRGHEDVVSNATKQYRQLSSLVLTKPPLHTTRISYNEGTTPTCLAIDPSYSRNKHQKQLLLGMSDGRLILSKLQTSSFNTISSFFGKQVQKVDTVIYQGMHPLETVAWRGNLLAWADESGVRLFDVQHMVRIACVDRPTGARTSLYPTIGTLRPNLVWERCDRLLIGWGDCLMGMRVYDATNVGGSGKEGMKKKVVECVMAWELDCVACGVVPVDERHVGVLGLVPCSEEEEEDLDQLKQEYFDGSNGPPIAGGDNMLELQIIHRETGKSISNDRVPMLEGIGTNNSDNTSKPNVADFQLLSSYATQRMEDLAEWDALNDGDKETIRNQVNMNEYMSNQTFPDAHLRWRMDNDICTTEFADVVSTEVAEDKDSTSSDQSVLSDDYVFALSQPMEDILADSIMPSRASPPTMIIVYKHDACLVQTRDADDAISYARSLGKPALALKTALTHRRDVRRHGIDLLVDEYFVALLRLRNQSDVPLSFSRLQIAAQSMPLLLGGDARMWQRWIFVFARVCGGLFAIREKIPVRDPWLPSFVFEMALEKMLQETCTSAKKSADKEKLPSQPSVSEKMSDLLLETLRAWGPTSSLRRRIQMHRYFVQSHSIGSKRGSAVHDATLTTFIVQAERDLRRRITQTAFGVLADVKSSDSETTHPTLRQHISSSDDSLYNVENMISKFSAKISNGGEERSHEVVVDSLTSSVQIGSLDKESVIVLELLAELELMRERYDRALGYFLTIGSTFIDDLSMIETAAVESVNTYHRSQGLMLSQENASFKYGHVLSLIELHQLHHFLLHQNYFFVDNTCDTETCSPIVSLIKLVGLERAGSFLMESCSPPDDASSALGSETVHFASLPLDLVADQLKSRPKLLYWYLFLLFVQKPEMYVKFATTAVPPVVVTDLHRTQFFLFVDHADIKASNETENAPSLFDVDEETPFMSFLVAALPYGGIRPESVIDTLENHRGGQIDSPIYARELAFVIEKFGSGDYEDAKKILQIYLLGAKNLFLAVAYAERNTTHSGALWEILITHCTEAEGHGALFGSLLEAAAHCGADLSSLVAKIPEGVAIEGLRPKLIAAVTDYRHKVKIHEFESNIQADDKVSIIRELSNLSRRGCRRVTPSSNNVSGKTEHNSTGQMKGLLQIQRERMSGLSIPSHLSNSCSLAIR